MSWKAEAHKIYEERVLKDALARLAGRFDLKTLPFSNEELQTLAKRAREAFRSRERKMERLEKYKAHLSAIHGTECVETISAALAEINNAIGYEEK
jgi:hypothetical protein